MNLVKDALGGWTGLNNTIKSLYIDKEYQYKCTNNVCKKPENLDELMNLLNAYPNFSDNVRNAIKKNAMENNLYYTGNIINDGVKKALQTLNSSTGTEDVTKCRLYYSLSKNSYEYVPIDCIHKFGVDSPVLNPVDKNTYFFMDSTPTPISGEDDRPTLVFRKDSSKQIFVIFGWGYVPSRYEINTIENKRDVIQFIANTLLPFLDSPDLENDDYMMVLCGHSSGMVNAFFVGEVLRHSAINDDYIISGINTCLRYNTEFVNGFESRKQNNINELAKSVQTMEEDIIKPDYVDYVVKIQQKITDYKPGGKEFETAMNELEESNNIHKENIDNLNKYLQFLKSDRIKMLGKKIFICGSAGYPCFGPNSLNYPAMKEFYHHRILHFRLPRDYFLETYLSPNGDIHRSDLIEINSLNSFHGISNEYLQIEVKFHTMADLINEQKRTDYTEFVNLMKDTNYTDRVHAWNIYEPILRKLYTTDSLIQKICDEYNITNSALSTLHGGLYHQLYIENKTAYRSLKKN